MIRQAISPWDTTIGAMQTGKQIPHETEADPCLALKAAALLVIPLSLCAQLSF